MTSLRHAGVLLALLCVASCHKSERAPLATVHPHYVVGRGWQGDGVWFYPREQFALRETGLAVRLDIPAGGLMADGALYDPAAMVGSHQTLQLPSVVVVRNLQTGRSVRLRIDGRGPGDPGRILAVSPKVAELLGMTSGPARVQIEEDEAASRALAEAMPGGPHLALAAAPVGAVTAQSLDPVAGIAGSARAVGIATGPERIPDATLAPLPVLASQGMVQPSALWIEIGRFSGASIANQAARRCRGTVQRGDGGDQGLDWLVRRGPYEDVADADQALRETFACGMPAARIIVE